MSRTADAGRMRRWLEALTPDTVVMPAANPVSATEVRPSSFSAVSAATLLQKR
jgi:malic enzyme